MSLWKILSYFLDQNNYWGHSFQGQSEGKFSGALGYIDDDSYGQMYGQRYLKSILILDNFLV
jgi:hypothetical protein